MTKTKSYKYYLIFKVMKDTNCPLENNRGYAKKCYKVFSYFQDSRAQNRTEKQFRYSVFHFYIQTQSSLKTKTVLENFFKIASLS